MDVNFAELPTNPRLRIPIIEYNSNIRDQVRRVYVQMTPCQPRDNKFQWHNLENNQENSILLGLMNMLID